MFSAISGQVRSAGRPQAGPAVIHAPQPTPRKRSAPCSARFRTCLYQTGAKPTERSLRAEVLMKLCARSMHQRHASTQTTRAGHAWKSGLGTAARPGSVYNPSQNKVRASEDEGNVYRGREESCFCGSTTCRNFLNHTPRMV